MVHMIYLQICFIGKDLRVMKKCNLCHELYSDNLIKCPHCGIMLERCVRSPQEEMAIRQRYKKSKSIKNYDTYKQSTGSKKPIGIFLMCGLIILDLIATVVLCFDEWNVFTYIITISAIIFIIGFFMRFFGN